MNKICDTNRLDKYQQIITSKMISGEVVCILVKLESTMVYISISVRLESSMVYISITSM